MSSTLKSRLDASTPGGWGDVAWDGESCDATLATTDYAPTVIGRAFRVGTTAGDVKVKTGAGNDVVIPNVLVGETVRIAFTKIYKTGTAAVGITAFS